MQQWIQQKYISLLSSRLRGFTTKSGNLYNFACPFCGDSSTNTKKKRGYLYLEKSEFKFFCHNCTKSYKFPTFLKLLDEELFSEAKKENLFSKDQAKSLSKISSLAVDKLSHSNEKLLEYCVPVSELKSSHHCKQYVFSRKIPEEFHDELLYCERFKEFTNYMCEEPKFSEDSLHFEEDRLVLPLYNKSKICFGFSGRSLIPNDSLRYIMINLDKNLPTVFGYHRVNTNKTYYCTEGQIDSLFIDNSIAICGSSITSGLRKLNDNIDNAVIVFDNEPRNKEILKSMNSAIENGFTIVIWPDQLTSKDVNDMVLSGENVQRLLKENIFQGLKAKARFTEWKKI